MINILINNATNGYNNGHNVHGTRFGMVNNLTNHGFVGQNNAILDDVVDEFLR